jgi:hypothetical protein
MLYAIKTRPPSGIFAAVNLSTDMSTEVPRISALCGLTEATSKTGERGLWPDASRVINTVRLAHGIVRLT